jgi:alkylhydroperoxidase family enzyme
MRIPPRPVEDWDDEVRDALSILKSRRNPGVTPTPPGDGAASAPPSGRPASPMIGMFAWHPALTKSWLGFSQHLSQSTLSDRVRELLIVRTVWLRHGEYEWVQHVKFARASGVSDDELAALSEGPDSAVWNEADAALIRAVDEMTQTHDITDATWAALAETYNRQQLMDIVFTIGAYDFHATAFHIFGLRLEPGVEGFPPGH